MDFCNFLDICPGEDLLKANPRNGDEHNGGQVVMEQQAENRNDLAVFAMRLAEHAGALSLKYFRKTLDVEHKADRSPVTVADRSIETAMRQRIEETYPHHGILGEEHGEENIDRANTWVLDPIDGTKSFITGMPTFGTLVAHLEHAVPVIGIIDMPMLDERWLGVAGQPALFNGSACKTSDCRRLADANIYATSPDMFDAAGKDAFDRVSMRAAMRRFGGDCYAYGLLASGHVDAVMEMQLEPYDYMALVPVIECAGGVITDWQGAPLHTGSDGHVIAAATPALHDEMLCALAA